MRGPKCVAEGSARVRSQGVVHWKPPPEALDAAIRFMSTDPRAHSYCADDGCVSIRPRAMADDWSEMLFHMGSSGSGGRAHWALGTEPPENLELTPGTSLGTLDCRSCERRYATSWRRRTG
jgi:hypothetical protein